MQSTREKDMGRGLVMGEFGLVFDAVWDGDPEVTLLAAIAAEREPSVATTVSDGTVSPNGRP